MTLEDAISMEPVKAKLKNLKEYLPRENEIVHEFGAYLADQLNSELVPAGFNLACELALEDLRRGGDYGTEKRPVPSHLVGYPPVMYSLLRMSIPKIAEAVCPPEFAQKVKKVIDEINTSQFMCKMPRK